MSETIHNRIAMLRAERSISRRQLAEALGVHYQTIGYLERGEYSPSLYLALRIAEYFEVPVEVVFSTAPFPRIGSTSVRRDPSGRRVRDPPPQRLGCRPRRRERERAWLLRSRGWRTGSSGSTTGDGPTRAS